MTACEARILLYSMFAAVLLHCGGAAVINIRKITPVAWPASRLFLIEDVYISKSAARDGSLNNNLPVPTYLSLPDIMTASVEHIALKPDTARYYRIPDDDEFFREADKMIAEEEYYYKTELDPKKFLPIAETLPDSSGYLSVKSRQESFIKSSGYYIHYSGYNRGSFAGKLETVKKNISASGLRPEGELIVSVSFSEKNEMLRCQIDRSSGSDAFDAEFLRQLKVFLNPTGPVSVKYRGRIIAGFDG